MTEIVHCEHCSQEAPLDECVVEKVQAYDGTELLAFCPDCTQERR